MSYNSDSEHSSDSDEARAFQDEVKRSIKEQDDFDNFLNAFYEAQNYSNFYFLKWVSACNVYELIKNEFVEYPNFDSHIHKMGDEEGDYYWCCELIYSADPETEINESKIYYFYVKMMNMSYLNDNYLKKNKIKLPTKTWKVVTLTDLED